MRSNFLSYLSQEIDKLIETGLYKGERVITSQQQPQITINDGSHVLNFCANNYLGLSNHPALLAAAKECYR